MKSKIADHTMKIVKELSGKEEKYDESPLLKGGEWRYANSEMLSQLKKIAVDPCNPRASLDSIQPLWNQALRLRKVTTLGYTDYPNRKRKLNHVVKDNIKASVGTGSKVLSPSFTQEKPTKLSRDQSSHASSVSCLVNTIDSNQCFDHETVLNSSSSGSLLTFENDNLRSKQISSGFLCLDVSVLDDSDESANGSNPLTPEKLNHCESPSPDCFDSVPSSNSRKRKSRETYLPTRRQSIRLQNFSGDHLKRLAVPVGPRFQADVPEYINTKDSDSENSKWLGAQVWPIEGQRSRTNTRIVGKGRSNSCSCGSPRSTDCIKRHVIEESRSIISDLGPTFFEWKFDEMGEAVSNSWSLKDQKSFASLVKKFSPSNEKNLLKHALKCFPRKCEKSIVSYYLNVYVPRRIRLQTESNVEQVDSDNEVTNLKDAGDKDVKSCYLRQCR